MMESTTPNAPHQSAKMKRRSFFASALAGGVGVFSLQGLMSRFRQSAQTPETEPRIKVSINPLAVSRTRQSSDTNG